MRRFGVRQALPPHLLKLTQQRATAERRFVPGADEAQHGARVGAQVAGGEVAALAQVGRLPQGP
ncbi:MAG TPA: hypothetical protein VEL76_11875 [Gemmataceae bacterium]|nr:hypothetical protein [Gemmataceae bacterium]